MNKENMCYLVDSGMNITTIKQDVIQGLIDNKTIGRLDIKEQVCCEDILDLIDELLVKFKLWNKYDMEYISRLDLDSISEKIYDEMYYYLFNKKSVNIVCVRINE